MKIPKLYGLLIALFVVLIIGVFAATLDPGHSAATEIDFTDPIPSDVLISGKVGIGNTNPGALIELADDLVIGDGTTSAGMTIYSSSALRGSIYFADGTETNSPIRGGIVYLHGDDSFRISTAANQRMKITNTGDVEIGGRIKGEHFYAEEDEGVGMPIVWDHGTGVSDTSNYNLGALTGEECSIRVRTIGYNNAYRGFRCPSGYVVTGVQYRDTNGEHARMRMLCCKIGR